MQADDPPSLPVGTAVSAKYKGAFCEAKVSKVVRIVKCKVTYKMGLGTATVSDEHIKGTLRVGQLVQVKHPEKKEFMDATITKIQDCSQYTVVFDDGDITTLRRTALCLKSGRHFNESETLDQLPLTHPEHFLNPVVGGRRGRRSRQMKEDSSEGETEEKNEPDLELYSADIGRVVSVEASDKKRSKDNWFPGLIVVPSAQPTVRINMKDEFLVRSFKDGRYYTVPKKEVTEFTRELGMKVESNILAEAVEKALKYLDHDELPVHWERSTLFNVQSQYSDSEENFSDDSTDEAYEEKDHFVAQLYKFMDDSGTPLNKSPTISNRDVDLYRLFRLVEKLGGYNRVTNQNKWRTISNRLKFSNSQAHCNQVKSVYKKFLLSYESFHRTLGVTMLNHPRTAKKNRGRSLIRDRDRTTPMNSPKPEKDDGEVEKKDEEKVVATTAPPVAVVKSKMKEEKKKEAELSDSSDDEQSEPTSSQVGRPKRADKKIKLEKVKIEKIEEQTKKEDSDDKGQQTRSKTITPIATTSNSNKTKEISSPEVKRDLKTPTSDSSVKSGKSGEKKEEKKRGRKRIHPEDKSSHSDSSATDSTTAAVAAATTAATTAVTPTQTVVNLGDKLKVYYGPTHESKVTYEAKVIEIEKDASGPIYLVHYTGWNTRYDEWIQPQRIAENLSAATKAKRLKQNAMASTSKASTSKTTATKRGRGISITGRSSAPDGATAPRSTTPSSVTSSSSRTKSPAVPTTSTGSKSGRISTRGRTRRISAQTDNSIHSESESDAVSDSETEIEVELSRTRSGKVEDGLKGKKAVLKRKDKEDEDGEREEDVERTKRGRRMKDVKSADETDDDGTNPPKGRDFDLNQIRSELKGITKVVKLASTDSSEREVLSSDDSNMLPDVKPPIEELEEKKVEDKPTDDIYEFKEPEPFEFETRSKLTDEKTLKKRLTPRLFEETEKSPKKKPPTPEKRGKKTPIKKDDESDEDLQMQEKKIEDPFDKLVESPSFRIVKSVEKLAEKPKVVRNINLEEPLSLFKDIDEEVDDACVEPLDISEESQSQPLFSSKEDNIFSESFAKTIASDCPSLSQECLGFKDERKKDSDDDETLKDTIQRITQSTMTDEESSDGGLLMKNKDAIEIKFTTFGCLPERKEEPIDVQHAKMISPALQETDTNLLKSIYEPQPELLATKLDETKEINLKTGAKVAESILQKFNMLKNQQNPETDDVTIKTEDTTETKTKSKQKKTTKSIADLKKPPQQRNRKYVSPEFVDSDSDSSDSEQLVIARSDEDSQNNLSEDKSDMKESDSNISFVQLATVTDESQSQDEERNFKFTKEPSPLPETSKNDTEPVKEEEPDSNLHSLLLCEETIPGSPAPATETTTPTIIPQQQQPPPSQKNKSLMEMPFASVPSSSNSKNVLVNTAVTVAATAAPAAAPPQQQQQQAQVQPFVLPHEPRDNHDMNTVLDNTPPTTPESSISNLSPRGECGGLSPPSGDNDSGKSTEADDFRRNAPYSEEDTLSNAATDATIHNKKEQAAPLVGCRKRRRSFKGPDEVVTTVAVAPPAKRGRKPAVATSSSSVNRSRQNSDSDDTSEHSMLGGSTVVSAVIVPSGGGITFERRSPRPTKYNFFVELDPGLDSGQRIAVLQQKLSELRKTYADVKAELATIERRRKKIRRREREALKAAKQEVVCT